MSLKLGDPPPLQEPWYFYLANCAINLNTALPLFLLLPFLSIIPRRMQIAKPKTASMLLILSPAYLWVAFRESLSLSQPYLCMVSSIYGSPSGRIFPCPHSVHTCRLLRFSRPRSIFLASGASCDLDSPLVRLCKRLFMASAALKIVFPHFSIAPTAQGGTLPLHCVPADAHICGGVLR